MPWRPALPLTFTLLAMFAATLQPVAAAAPGTPQLALAGDYATGLGELSAETVAYEQNRMFVTNTTGNSLDIVDITNPAAPILVRRVALAAYGAGPNSVDVNAGRVAVAMEANPKTNNGKVAFFDRDGNPLGSLGVGALPDMLTFTPDGKKLIVANEGEPNSYGQPGSVDPEGTVSIISLTLTVPPSSWVPGTVTSVHFRDFNVGGPRHAQLPAGIRIFGPGATVAKDLEPEYVVVSADSKTAYVTLQENNGLAVIDLVTKKVSQIRALGLKDHNLAGAGLDASDRDNAINIANWPVSGMYQPDAVAYVTLGGTHYLVTANEGDARDYVGYAEEVRVGSGAYPLDPTVFPNGATLKQNANLGRLTVSKASGNTDLDGDFDRIDVFGARSFTLWNAASGVRVWDSGDGLERTVAAVYPGSFNASNNNNTFDDRSDNKGPEPEGLTLGEINGRQYAFVGLERIGGLAVYDLTNPTAPEFVQYANNRNLGVLPPAQDSGPEVLRFIAADKSPTGLPLVLVANEISGTVAIYEDRPPSEAGTLSLLHNNDGESSLLPLQYATGAGTLNVGSAAAYKAVLNREITAARGAKNSVVNVYAGDALLASSTLACSLPPNPPTTPVYDALAQRQMAYDAHILGNHEFDFAPDFLERFIRGFTVNGRLDQPFLSANLDFAGEPGFANLIDSDGLIVNTVTDGRVVSKSMIITDRATGARFGVVSATTWLLPTISSPRNVVLLSTDLASTASLVQGEINRLQTTHGLKKLIFVSHLQDVNNDRSLIALLRGVDLAVAGGGDELLANPGLPLGSQLLPGETQAVAGTYPLTQLDADGRTVYIVTTAGNYKYLGRIDATFDSHGEIATIAAATSFPRRVVPTSAVATALGLTDAVTPDPGIVATVDTPVQACLAALSSPIVGSQVVLDVARGTATISGSSITLSPGVRTTETNAGNLIADSYLAAYDSYAAAAGLPARDPVSNVVVAVQNGGGIRQNAGNVLPVPPQGVPGTISRKNTLDVLSFLTNAVSVVNGVTPAQLKQIFERSAAVPGGGQFLQLAALRVTLDYTRVAQQVSSPPPGEQAGSITVAGDRVRSIVFTNGTATTADDVPIITNGLVDALAPASLRVVSNSFTAAGGDNFPTFEDITNRTQFPATYEQAWVEYLLDFPPTLIGSVTVPTVPASDPRYAVGGEGRLTLILP